MNAKRVKSAGARATIAARMIKTYKVLGRSFDDCFEMGDGSEVKRLLIEKAKKDMGLLRAMLYDHYNVTGHWADEVLKDTGIKRAHVFYFQN